MVDSFFNQDDGATGKSEIPSLDDTDQGQTSGKEQDRDRGVIAAVLSYIPFLCLVPLLQMRDNEQARFHSRQGLILFLIELLALLAVRNGLENGHYYRPRCLSRRDHLRSARQKIQTADNRRYCG